MAFLNKVQLIGNVGKKPVGCVTKANGHDFAAFTLATNEVSNGKKYTKWHKVVAWGKLAKNVKEYIDKGRLVYVEGRLDYETEGEYKGQAFIVAHNVQFLDFVEKA